MACNELKDTAPEWTSAENGSSSSRGILIVPASLTMSSTSENSLMSRLLPASLPTTDACNALPAALSNTGLVTPSSPVLT